MKPGVPADSALNIGASKVNPALGRLVVRVFHWGFLRVGRLSSARAETASIVFKRCFDYVLWQETELSDIYFCKALWDLFGAIQQPASVAWTIT
jgi:hypothetical protein